MKHWRVVDLYEKPEVRVRQLTEDFTMEELAKIIIEQDNFINEQKLKIAELLSEMSDLYRR